MTRGSKHSGARRSGQGKGGRTNSRAPAPDTRSSVPRARTPAPARAARRAIPNTFGPHWLAHQLATLVPAFPDTPLCVALSGGVDSTALLAALAAVHPRPTHVRALHVDHGLRPTSREWAQHCRTLGQRLHIPLHVLTTRVKVPRGASLEAAAREARYELLASALQPRECLLLAHHADDQLETVLLQLLRGSGLPGLAAMPAVAPFAHGLLVRPLLSRSRAELESWARAQELTWIEDDSNLDETLNRNYLRRRILPLIHERWPGGATAVARSARHAAAAQSLLDSLARADIERASHGESLRVKTLRALPAERLNNALRFWIARAGARAPDTRRLEEITGPLMSARDDANPVVAWDEGATRVQRHNDLLTLYSRQDAPAAAARSRSTGVIAPAALNDLLWPWHDSPTCPLPHQLGKLELQPDPHGPIDLDALPHPLTIRWRRGGERLAPRRGGPRRALKSLLQESHVPVAERARLPLLFSVPSAGAKLLAVADWLLDEAVQPTPTTRRRARLRWMRA